MMYNCKKNNGFTIIEILVSITLLALALLSLGSLVVTLQTAKRNNDALSDAVYAMRDSNEQMRTLFITLYAKNQVNLCGFTQDLSGSLTKTKLTNAHGTSVFTCVDGIYGIKRLDTTIYYDIGNVTKSVQSSTFVGNGGLYQ